MKKTILSAAVFALLFCLHTATASGRSDNTNVSDGDEQPVTAVREVCDFLQKCGTYYLATVEGDQPRVRPFGTATVFENNIYIQTGKRKNVSRQMAANPKVEICAYDAPSGTWIRIEATAVNDDRREAKLFMLEQYPGLASMYSADDENTQVLYLKNVTATFSSFAGEPRVVKF
ncbi:MAG: pyridoxamine 5'-phosphate oxidase family protein [Prevotellaceae bacterium]|jgi:uncharacterized pyridoxamine 5'-phosphate oxidase family protein|nr:pyridoxamine 5'-phosphate oxidase family protein [Prevotellaceae bacterium]